MIYPRFYHYRGKNQSDKGFIFSRMRIIPDDQKRAVSLQYEAIYLDRKNPNRRKDANTYLHNEAVKQRDKLKAVNDEQFATEGRGTR